MDNGVDCRVLDGEDFEMYWSWNIDLVMFLVVLFLFEREICK